MEGRSFLSRPRMRSRAATKTGSTLPELETLSSYSALEARAVTLSADEALVVSRLAELLLADTLRAYEAHLAAGGRADPREWKLVKRKDQLAVFKQRREAAPQAPRWAAGSSSSSATDMTGDLAATAQRETTLPMLLVLGSLPSGTSLDDAMFGLSSGSTREFKLNSAYAEDSAVVDAAVLSALEQPTADDPFRFLGLKWAARRHGGSLKKRDLLFLEATGVARLPRSGDRVGYRVMHSVSVRALAQLGAVAVADSVVRAKASVVQLFHEAPPSSSANGGAFPFAHSPVRVFARGFYDPMGGMMHFVALNVAAELLLTLAHGPADCAHLKKIAKAAQRAQRERTRRRRRSTATAMAAGGGLSPSGGVRKRSRFPTSKRFTQDSSMRGIVEVDEAMGGANGSATLYPPSLNALDMDDDMTGARLDEDEPVLELSPSLCHVCERSLGGVFDRSGAPCTICFHTVCSRCSVTKKLRFPWSDDSARGLGLGLAAGVDTSGGGVTASSTSQSQGSTERSRSRSGSGASRSRLATLQHSQMADVAAKPLNFCLPCVVAANQQSGALLAVEDMMSRAPGSAAVAAALRTRTASYMDAILTPTSAATPMGRATAASLGYNGGGRLSISSTASGASASTTPRQRWTRGASIYGARPTYDLLDYYNTGSASRKSLSQAQAQHRASSGPQYFPQPQHQYRVYGKDAGSSGSGGGQEEPASARQSQRQKAFSLAAASTPRDSAPKVVLFDVDDYARRASRV